MLDADPALIQRRAMRESMVAAADIAAVVVARASPLQASQLLAAYGQMREASAATQQVVFADPRTTVLLDKVGMLASRELWLGEQGAIEQAIQAFAILALSSVLVDGGCWGTAGLISMSGSFILPGTFYRVRLPPGIGHFDLSISSGPTLNVNGQTVPLHEVCHIDAFQLVTSEDSLSPPESSGITAISLSNTQEQKWVSGLGKACDALKRHPPSLKLAHSFGRLIAPVQGDSVDVHCSVSFSSRPGVLYMSWSPNSLVLAEGIVHESDHQFYDTLTRGTTLWSDLSDAQVSRYRSPWREDPRPLDGLLTGASAFIRVSEFWECLLNKPFDTVDDLNFVGQRCALSVLQSLDAISTIQAHGPATDVGGGIVENLQKRGLRVLASIQTHPKFADWQKAATAQQVEHNRDWIARNGPSTDDIARTA